MAMTLSCYYLDEPLTDEELQFVERTLLGPWATFKTGALTLTQKRVPLVLPTPGPDGQYPESRERRAGSIRRNLRHAGIRADTGRQVAWVVPQDGDWDAIFRFAIHQETGFAPFAVQRWTDNDGKLVRAPVRVIDTQVLVQGL